MSRRRAGEQIRAALAATRLLLMFDEVRASAALAAVRLPAYRSPDIMALAKALGGGFRSLMPRPRVHRTHG
jgi:acetylornithine/succinyldiaminopimelate/putrescine aminotransferase